MEKAGPLRDRSGALLAPLRDRSGAGTPLLAQRCSYAPARAPLLERSGAAAQVADAAAVSHGSCAKAAPPDDR